MNVKIAFLLMVVLINSPRLMAYDDIEILHWWTSDGEQKAAKVVQKALKAQGIQWVDAAIEGGGGEGAMAVLKSRVLQGNAPAAAQIIGPDIQVWANLGFLGQFNIVALAHDWPKILHPTVDHLIQHRGQYVAVPFGIHRINWLWVNKAQLNSAGATAPLNWDEFFELAETFREQGIIPLAHGNEPWQNMTLFEVLILSIGGDQFYRDVFVDQKEEVINSDRFAESLRLLAKLKTFMDDGINGRSWQQATAMVAQGQAGMQIMGDWVLGELTAWQQNDAVECFSAPETDALHLYSVDTMVMFNDPHLSSYQTQVTFAETILKPEVQLGYSRAKGAVPVRNDISIDELTDCARQSYSLFAQNEAKGQLSPSMAHGMAAQSEIEDIFLNVIHSFFQAPKTPVSQVQEKLIANLRSIRK